MDDRKRTKSEVEIRNGNGKIDKIKCKIPHKLQETERMEMVTGDNNRHLSVVSS